MQDNVNNLNFTADKGSSLKLIEFIRERMLFHCSINFNDIISAEFLEDSVLVVKFRDGEIRLDISRSQLTGLLNVDG